jgi:hypothetical protein
MHSDAAPDGQQKDNCLSDDIFRLRTRFQESPS